MIIKDIWGVIKIEPYYEKIINSREFIALKNKSQLGLNCNDNAIHTRYQHSLGVYYLACKLIDICKQKFSSILDITLEDEQAIKCMALVHDIGHGCFSHVSEKFLDGTHEDNSVKILMDENSEINRVIIDTFGRNVLEKTIFLIKLKEHIKDKDLINTNPSLIFIVSKLLSGGIDIDRIDYIYRDSINVFKEQNDFSNILDSIELGYIDNDLEIIFSSDAEYKIANFFNKRFELYDTLYLNNETRILENIFNKFLAKTNINLNWNTTEIEMNNLFRTNICSKDILTRRCAQLLAQRKLDDNFLIKEVNSQENYKFLETRLLNLFSSINSLKIRQDCIYTDSISKSKCSTSIYNSKNKIFIDKGGVIQEMSDCSKILNLELKKDKYIIAVDLLLLRKMLEMDGLPPRYIDVIITNIKDIFSSGIEQEKKYIIESTKPSDEFKKIIKALKLINHQYIVNIDTYYDDEDKLLEKYRINLRRRVYNGIEEYTVKRPFNDKSSITKREEINFLNLDDAIDFIRNIWLIPIKTIKERYTFKTEREKYNLEYCDGIFEIVYDKTSPVLKNIPSKDIHMVECEFKRGNSSFLYFIDKTIQSFDFIEECKLSKKEIVDLDIFNCDNNLDNNELPTLRKRKILSLKKNN